MLTFLTQSMNINHAWPSFCVNYSMAFNQSDGIGIEKWILNTLAIILQLSVQ